VLPGSGVAVPAGDDAESGFGVMGRI
jgi:hypothetical protein